MPRISTGKIKKAQIVIRRRKVFTVENIVALLGCSIPTVRLKLRRWHVHTSYNKSGQYYALPGVPQFDENGLWWHRDAYFSEYGTLKNTVVHLIGAASAGFTGEQIGRLVGLDPRSFLFHFRDAPGIRREKHRGVYVYFSDDEARYLEQVANRLEEIALGESIGDAEAVVILVALINHHDITVDYIASLPEVKGKGLQATAIENYLQHHGLGKKTLRSKP